MSWSRSRKLLIAFAAIVTMTLGASSAVLAVSNTDTGDHFSLKAGTVISTHLQPGGNKLVLTFSLNGVTITTICDGFTASGTIPATGLSIKISAPTFSGCTDSATGTDTITTSGAWRMQEIDTTKGDSAEPNKGDTMKLFIPKDGAIWRTSILTPCMVTFAPSGTAAVNGPYNDVNTISDTTQPVPVAGTGCVASGATISATLVLSKSVHDT